MPNLPPNSNSLFYEHCFVIIMKTPENQNFEQKKERIPDFEDIDFENLDWENLDSISKIYDYDYNRYTLDASHFSRKILFKGKKLSFSGLRQFLRTESENKLSHEKFRFIISCETPEIKQP